MSIRVGIVGVSGYGGGEALRLCATHPQFEVLYAAGESSAGTKLIERYPGISARLADLVVQKWDPADLPDLDVLVVPSRWYENTPLVMHSALATGTPLIVTDLGGMSELVRHEHNLVTSPRTGADTP